MLDRTRQPEIKSFEIPNLPHPRQFRFRNGIVFHIVDNPQLELIHFTVRIKAGPLYEPKKRLAGFTYKLLKESHPTLSPDEVDAFLDFYGTAMTVTAGIAHITVNLQIPKKNCAVIVPFVAELLACPRFKEAELERYRKRAIQDFEYNQRKVGVRCNQLMFNTFFHENIPFGKSAEKSDYESIDLQQIIDYHNCTYIAENIRLYATGHWDDELTALFQDNFSQIRNGEWKPVLPENAVRFKPGRIAEHWDNAQQTAVQLCRPHFAFSHGDAHRFKFLNTLFCNYFGSRLMQNLREKNGFTYGISSGTIFFENSSIYYIESDINNEKVEAALQEIFNEMDILRNTEIDAEEMEIVRNYLLGNILQSIDGTVPYLEYYMGLDFFGCDEHYLLEQIRTIKSITAEEVTEMAKSHLRPEMFSVITVGR